jgi:hypothetical protein
MFFQIAYILLGLSAIPDVLSENPRTAGNTTSNTHYEAPAESTSSLAKSATLQEPHNQAYGDGLSPWSVDSVGEAEPSRTILSSSQTHVSTMALHDRFHDVESTVSNPYPQTSTTPNWQDSPGDIASIPWTTGSTAHATPAPGSTPVSSSSSSSLAAYGQESAGLAQKGSPLSHPEQCFYYTENGDHVQQAGTICGGDIALDASSSAPNTTSTPTPASNKTPTATSPTGSSHTISTASAWDPIKAALNWLTSATTSTSSSSKCTNSASISTTDPAQVALDWLTAATTSTGLECASTLSTTTTDSRCSDDASAIVAQLEATHTSYAAAGRLRPGFW